MSESVISDTPSGTALRICSSDDTSTASEAKDQNNNLAAISDLHSSGDASKPPQKISPKDEQSTQTVSVKKNEKSTITEQKIKDLQNDAKRLKDMEGLFQEMTMENSKLKFELEELRSSARQESDSVKVRLVCSMKS